MIRKYGGRLGSIYGIEYTGNNLDEIQAFIGEEYRISEYCPNVYEIVQKTPFVRISFFEIGEVVAQTVSKFPTVLYESDLHAKYEKVNDGCEYCKDTDDIISVCGDLSNIGVDTPLGGRLRFDTELDQLDLIVEVDEYPEIESSVKIFYCPMCGRKLSDENE